MVVAVEAEAEFGAPRLVFDAPYETDPDGRRRANYDVADDGRFLMIRRSGGPVLHLSQNWTQELLERVPVP